MGQMHLTGGDGVSGQTGEEFRLAIEAMMTELYSKFHTRAHSLIAEADHPALSDVMLFGTYVGINPTTGKIECRFLDAADIPADIARVSDVETHINDTANPHGVTAAQLGIDTTGYVAGNGIGFDTTSDPAVIYSDINGVPLVNTLDNADTFGVSVEGATKQISLYNLKNLLSDYISYRGRIYDSVGNYHGVEVLATGSGILATLENGNELTFEIPEGIRIISAKIVAVGYPSLVVKMGTGDMGNSNDADRWSPICQAWRQDTGGPLTGVTISLHTTVFDEFTINGLVSGSVNNLIRLSF